MFFFEIVEKSQWYCKSVGISRFVATELYASDDTFFLVFVSISMIVLSRHKDTDGRKPVETCDCSINSTRSILNGNSFDFIDF